MTSVGVMQVIRVSPANACDLIPASKVLKYAVEAAKKIDAMDNPKKGGGVIQYRQTLYVVLEKCSRWYAGAPVPQNLPVFDKDAYDSYRDICTFF